MKPLHSLLLPALLALVPSSAQAAMKMVSGTVKTIDAKQIVLTQNDGKEMAVPLAKDTMFMRGNAMVGAP